MIYAGYTSPIVIVPSLLYVYVDGSVMIALYGTPVSTHHIYEQVLYRESRHAPVLRPWRKTSWDTWNIQTYISCYHGHADDDSRAHNRA